MYNYIKISRKLYKYSPKGVRVSHSNRRDMAQRKAPYHRVGAIDNNARYDVAFAEAMHQSTRKRSRTMYDPVSATNLQLSVQVFEPLYARRHQQDIDSKCNIAVLSSLNAMELLPSREQLIATMVIVTAPITDFEQKLTSYSAIRDIFFQEIGYIGVSLAVWDRAQEHQAPDIAITHGGLCTIECHAPFQIGDYVVVDMPWTDKMDEVLPAPAVGARMKSNPGYPRPNSDSCAFTKCSRKNGKITLAVVPLPRRPPTVLSAADFDHWDKFINGYFRRGQVIGKCTRGNQNGNGDIDMIAGFFPGGPI